MYCDIVDAAKRLSEVLSISMGCIEAMHVQYSWLCVGGSEPARQSGWSWSRRGNVPCCAGACQLDLGCTEPAQFLGSKLRGTGLGGGGGNGVENGGSHDCLGERNRCP